MRRQIPQQRQSLTTACAGADLDSQGAALVQRLLVNEPSVMTDRQLREAMLAAEAFVMRASHCLKFRIGPAATEVVYDLAELAG